MRHDLEQLVLDAWKTRPSGASGGLGLAVSGGVDSMVLLDVVARLRDREPTLEDTVVLHLDHGLRPGSADDAELVAAESTSRGLAYAGRRLELKARHEREGGSLEDLARRARYGFLAEESRSRDLAAVMTAHHADDQAETVLMQMMRGTALLGLAGMPPSRPLLRGRATRLMRPLLDVEHDELVDHARHHGVPWHEDESNHDLRHRRNFVRQVLLPLMNDEPPGDVPRRLRDLAGRARAANARITRLVPALGPRVGLDVAEDAAGRRASFRLDPLRALPTEVAYLLFDRIVHRCDATAPPLAPKLFAKVFAAQDDSAPALEVTRSLHIEVGPSAAGGLGVTVTRRAAKSSGAASWAPQTLEIPGTVVVAEADREIEAELLEHGEPSHSPAEQLIPQRKIRGPLVVRRPEKAERLRPFGLDGEKLVSDLLNEARIPASRRWSSPVVADDEGILWIPGVRAAERCRITRSEGPFVRLSARETQA